jgi:mono/diheme cytochrome c family protein
MLEQVYGSAWHLPAVTLLAVSILFVFMARKVPFIVGYSTIFAWLIFLDAWINGALSPIPPGSRTVFEITFIVLGDWRFFLFFERYSMGGLNAERWFRALLTACITPLLALGLLVATPELNMRVLFLFFECVMFTIVLIFKFVILPRRRVADAGNQSFVAALTRFELLQYALWIVADILLLSGQSWAMVIRLTANIFYYSLFIPFVWWRAPDSPDRRHAVLPVAAMAVLAFVLSFGSLGAGMRAQPVASVEPPASLLFKDGGKDVSTVSLAKMMESLPVEEVAAFDPYYQHNKRWRAVSIESVLRSGFNREPNTLLEDEFVLRAEDGFAAYFPGKRLLEGGAYVAFKDLNGPQWEPIGPRKDNPGPFYLVWSGADQQSLETHARPWQLASIEIVSFDAQFPHVRPERASADSSAGRGFQTFRVQCLPCHAINRAGGKVGPELNVPRNILEYRDPAVVRAFIKDPLSFRYTIMPAHPKMTPSELDELMAYLNAMKTQKHDKDRAGGE